MDAITLLKEDHQTVEKLFKEFEDAGDRAFVTKGKIVSQVVEELAIHAAIEEQLFYPVTRDAVPETEKIALESLEEHHVVKWLLAELDGMDPKAERFNAKMKVLMENVRHHVEEEEGEYFPMVRDALGRNALGELGDALEAAKSAAPTHPRPEAPDTPPGNLVAGTAAGVVDRVSEAVVALTADGFEAVLSSVKTARNEGRKAVTRAARAVNRKASEGDR